ncbi:hypothetical protein B566_EDAN016805 [Ephemera danica]|nr:hypothetical protein B566_EDAN016805 [Ephemera danica]
MTADCGLGGTKRLACKQHSTVDVKHMELKLQCPNGATASETSIATPPRPPTRHRRDTKASTAATPHSASTDVTAEKSNIPEKISTELPESTVTEKTIAVYEKTDSVVTEKTTVPEKTVTELPEKTNPDVISTSLSPEFDTPTRPSTDVRTSTTPSISSTVISTSPPAIVTGTPRAITPETTTIIDTTTKPAVTTPPTTRLTTLAITPGIPPLHTHSVHHQVSPGIPRNVAALTHIANHPPMVIAVSAAGLPRNVASVPREHAPLPPPLLHPLMAEGAPRIATEEFVTSWRRQFLPSPLRGISTPHTHPHSTTPEDVEDEEEEETTAAAATAEPMNSQTEEELMEAARRRQHSRRTSRPQQSSHPGRNLYPYLINRMLG